jgi:hypothetical protein
VYRGGNVSLLTHTIGKVEVKDGCQIVKMPNFDTTQKLVDWVYKSFTGKSLSGAENKYKDHFTKISRWL